MSRNVTIGSTRTAVALTFAAAVFLSAAWLTLPGCGGGAGPGSIAAAVGSYGDVAVLVSNPAYGRTFPDILERVLPRERFVLHEEPVYRTSFFSGKEWRKGRNFRNLLLLVRWGDGGPVQDLAARLVSADTRRRLLAAGGGVVTRHDPLFKRQLAVVVLAPTAKRLREVVEQQGAALADTLARDIRRRIVADHRDQGLLTASMAKAARECGFTLEIPATWRENQFRPDGYPGVEWLWLDGATRGITVAWRPLPDPAAALDDTATLRDLRRDLGHTLHHEELVPSSLRWGRERVADRPAVRLAGDWRSNRVSVGGPFRSYFVADPEQGRLYCLDLLVYAPNREKMDDFRRLRAILETFRTGDDRAP